MSLSHISLHLENREAYSDFALLQLSAIVAGRLPTFADMRQLSSDDWLPPGWTVETRLTSTGRKYKVVFASTIFSNSRVSALFLLILSVFLYVLLIGVLVSVFSAGVRLAFRKLVF